MTAELIKQVKNWQALKYRPHRTTVFGKKSTTMVTPVKKDDDVLLAFWTWRKEQPTPAYLADTLGNEFRELATTLNIPKKNGKYILTFHRLRAYVFSTISGLGDSEFANWVIGHTNSTYYRRSEKDKRKAFSTFENYLTFLDISALEARGADVETKLEMAESRYNLLAAQIADLFRIQAIEDPTERARVMQEASRKWVETGLYSPAAGAAAAGSDNEEEE